MERDEVTPVIEAALPRCGWCEADPGNIATSFAELGGARIAVFRCADCRAIHSVQLLGVAQQYNPRITLPTQ